jgi:hypothetical protein
MDGRLRSDEGSNGWRGDLDFAHFVEPPPWQPAESSPAENFARSHARASPLMMNRSRNFFFPLERPSRVHPWVADIATLQPTMQGLSLPLPRVSGRIFATALTSMELRCREWGFIHKRTESCPWLVPNFSRTRAAGP